MNARARAIWLGITLLCLGSQGFESAWAGGETAPSIEYLYASSLGMHPANGLLADAGSGILATSDDEDNTPIGDPWPPDWLVGDFNTHSKWITGALGVALGGYLLAADTQDIRDLGDITQFLPLVTAAGMTFGVQDREGMRQLALAAGTTLVATQGLKYLVEKTRPDNSDDVSFPSGHTSASFVGSSFIWRRYGPRWGAPATVLAAYTGFSRVVGQKHFLDDVISGASIGVLSNLLWTHPVDDRVRLSLFPTDGGAGIQLDVDPNASRHGKRAAITDSKLPGRYFLWEIGGADVVRNDVRVPGTGGQTIDWRFNNANNPTTTAGIAAGWAMPDRRHNFYLALFPFEVREIAETSATLEFKNREIPAGTTIRSRYLGYDYRLGYGYSLVSAPRFGVELTASLAAFDTVVSLEFDNPELDRNDFELEESATVVRPTVGGRIEWAMTPHWLLFSELAFWSDSEVKLLDFTTQLAYRIDDNWAVSLGYRRVNRTVDDGDLYNVADRNQAALGIWYLF